MFTRNINRNFGICREKGKQFQLTVETMLRILLTFDYKCTQAGNLVKKLNSTYFQYKKHLDILYITTLM